MTNRPPQLDLQLRLGRADAQLGEHEWEKALDLLDVVRDQPLARPLLVKALSELGDLRRTIKMLWPPQGFAEIVTLGGAVLEAGTTDEAAAFIGLPIVSQCPDASVRDMTERIKQRRLG
jgi:hypothetical protein